MIGNSTASHQDWRRPLKTMGALSGAVVVLGFIVAHGILISDIWSGLRRMIFAGVLCGVALVWSYNRAVSAHSTRAWFGYSGMYAGELVALGALSLLILRPRYSMAELMVADDAFERLLPPSLPFIAGAIVVGTVGIWLYFGRKPAAFVPILVTQILLVFLLGHQFAFLGLVETSTALLVVFGEFALFTVFLAGAFSLGVMSTTIALARRRSQS